MKFKNTLLVGLPIFLLSHYSHAAVTVVADGGGIIDASTFDTSFQQEDIVYGTASTTIDGVTFNSATSPITAATQLTSELGDSGLSGSGLTEVSSIDGTFTLSNFQTAPNLVVNQVGVLFVDLFDGSDSKTLTLTATTNLDTYTFTIGEGNGNPTLGFNFTGDFDYNFDGVSSTGAPVEAGHNTYTSFVFTSSDSSEYFTDFAFDYPADIAGGADGNNENAHFVSLDFETTLIPEPSSTSLLGIAALSLVVRRRRNSAS